MPLATCLASPNSIADGCKFQYFNLFDGCTRTPLIAPEPSSLGKAFGCDGIRQFDPFVVGKLRDRGALARPVGRVLGLHQQVERKPRFRHVHDVIWECVQAGTGVAGRHDHRDMRP